ncbi:putative geraniol 8-hydroxylase [Iris pallida]|uniref:Geraniol 8-hydroxylase n=1 Tax=Iris pallida TaxID=29817 RepID=A0AAX6I815_IRIPA|nr:putative geraniol 8-hydroxylase [Iris pallida]KAJ6849416.1 putative geraniol 8-hydroxylase [Iris pallida]
MEEVGKPNLVDFFPLLAPIDPHGRRRKVAKCFVRLFGMIDEIIDRRLKLMKEGEQEQEQKSYDLLDELLHLQLDRPTLRSLLADYFIAGSDTSSVTVGWAMAELLRNPSLMATARTELANTVGPTREVMESDIPSLSFLRAVVKETFRLHPTTPLLLPQGRGGRGAGAVRRAEAQPGRGERLGHRPGRERVGGRRSFQAGEVPGERGGLPRPALRADTVRRGPADVSRDALG